jgi:hypothetical protein
VTAPERVAVLVVRPKDARQVTTGKKRDDRWRCAFSIWRSDLRGAVKSPVAFTDCGTDYYFMAEEEVRIVGEILHSHVFGQDHDKTHNDLADAPSHVVVHFTALHSVSKPSIASSFPRCPTWYLPNLLNRLEALARSKSAAVARPLRDHDASGAVVHACPTLKRYKESKKAWGFHADMPNKLFLVLQCGKLQHQTITSRKHKAEGADVDTYRTLHPTLYTCTTPIFSAQRSNGLRRLQYIKPLLQSSPPLTASSVFVPSAF